jgi:hypothetical protein
LIRRAPFEIVSPFRPSKSRVRSLSCFQGQRRHQEISQVLFARFPILVCNLFDATALRFSPERQASRKHFSTLRQQLTNRRRIVDGTAIATKSCFSIRRRLHVRVVRSTTQIRAKRRMETGITSATATSRTRLPRPNSRKKPSTNAALRLVPPLGDSNTRNILFPAGSRSGKSLTYINIPTFPKSQGPTLTLPYARRKFLTVKPGKGHRY